MIPIVSFVGYSNSGKTTLICQLIKELKFRGFRIATIKHSPHGQEQINTRGKDSFLHWMAGADIACVSSPHVFSLVKRVEQEITPDDIALNFSTEVDLIVTEGYKRGCWPKIGVAHWLKNEKFPLQEEEFIALICDEVPEKLKIPCFKRDEIGKIADFILNYFNLI